MTRKWKPVYGERLAALDDVEELLALISDSEDGRGVQAVARGALERLRGVKRQLEIEYGWRNENE